MQAEGAPRTDASLPLPAPIAAVRRSSNDRDDSAGSVKEGGVWPGMGWDAEGGQTVEPCSSNGSTPVDACLGCIEAAEADRRRSQGGGGDLDSASNVAIVQHQHTCGLPSQEIAMELPLTMLPHGTIPAMNAPSQKHRRVKGTATPQLAQQGAAPANVGDLATPLASAGAGDVGAECDVTPLQSRAPRESSRGQGTGLADASLRGGGSRDVADTPEEATSGSGHAKSSSHGGEGKEGREGRALLRRKETITWESFLANMAGLSESDRAKEDENAKGAPASEQGSAPPAATREEPFEEKEHTRPGSAVKEASTVRTRYLRAMISNAGAVPWNTGAADDEDGDDGRSVCETESEGLPELSEGRAVNHPTVPRLVSDLSDRGHSPRHQDYGRSHSLSSVGLGSINNVRRAMEKGINKFNVNPNDGIAYLIENGLMVDTSESICNFLCNAEGLSKRRLGEYFGRDNAKAQEVLRLFLRKLNFKDVTLDEALRSMVVRFRLPGEAQQMDRVMENFAARYHEENPEVFSCPDTAWALAFGLMILNTDMYNRNIRESEKMTEVQFVKNHRGIDQGRDPPKELLEGMYRRIKASEIRMDEGDMYESEVITFVAPKKSGWLKKKSTGYVANWKRHWFVLNDAVLYYFITPQHQDEAPRCIIPLEGISIAPIGATDLSIGLRTNQGYVKSVKMADNGIMQQGHHRSFVLRAESTDERDMWVEALRAEVPAFQMELTATRSLSATPATSAAATPISTPSATVRRTSKFSTNGRDRRLRSTVDPEASGQMAPPVVRGWARTHIDQYKSGGRRYMALFRNVGLEGQDDVVYFFGDASMCDKMIDHHLPTSHGSLTLSDVTRVQLRQEEGGGGARAIALQTATGERVKETVIVLEEQREFLTWMRHIKECCPDSAYSIAADGTPIAGGIGDVAFPSNTVDPNGDGTISSVSRAIADHIGVHDDAFVSVGRPSTAESVAGTADSKGRNDSAAGSDAYGRSESSETQPVAACGASDRGLREVTRIITTASSVTEADHPAEQGKVHIDAENDVQSPPGLMRPRRTAREGSTPGTDVE